MLINNKLFKIQIFSRYNNNNTYLIKVRLKQLLQSLLFKNRDESKKKKQLKRIKLNLKLKNNNKRIVKQSLKYLQNIYSKQNKFFIIRKKIYSTLIKEY